MEIKTGYSYQTEAKAAIDEATKEFAQPHTLLFFSSVAMFAAVTKELVEKYPTVDVYGATTSTAFFENRSWFGDKNTAGLVVISFGDSFQCCGGVIEEISNRPIIYASRVQDSLKHFESTENTICLTFINAFRGAEELVLDTLNLALDGTNIKVAGSTCGNETNSSKTMISHNGRVYTDAAIYLLIRNLNGRVKIFRENIFNKTKKIVTATKVDVDERIVYEFNGIPAAEALAKSLYVKPEELMNIVGEHPLGRLEGDDINVVEIYGVIENNALKLHSSVFGGTKLTILELGDYSKCLLDFVADIRREVRNPQFVLFINCMSLTKLYKDNGWLPVFGTGIAAAGQCFAGISGYGEQKDRLNLNKSMLAVVFE